MEWRKQNLNIEEVMSHKYTHPVEARKDEESSKTIHAIVFALGSTPQLDGETLLLKTLVIRHEDIKLILTRKLFSLHSTRCYVGH